MTKIRIIKSYKVSDIICLPRGNQYDVIAMVYKNNYTQDYVEAEDENLIRHYLRSWQKEVKYIIIKDRFGCETVIRDLERIEVIE